ncbi:ATP-binding protein [Legionella anisa]|uniref:histidine kinase n=1 Tax=Legionella anisa TaxID=28082 RepID=A0AAX0WT29_9GAMM|nr:ATP-binding protein [Legionella anisa]AWN74852.1 hypothetical protein DLD14_13970 [Legionella anisa]KTC73851.1 sensor histidine kinase [Legionella anisa]MBN5936966.1 response regulator [Legionella anisa]MCW8424947.1 ATP-binding protein [Legionella anisa]MCW8445933.1 ATP-binding protein [Legionella anisa]
MNSESFFSFFKNLFSNDFMPHGHCYFWRPDIVWLHVISDSLIALSYFAIPIILIFFMLKRKDFPFPWVLIMFGAFILLCGTTHVMGVVTLWDPLYRLDGIIKAATAGVSVLTTIMLVPLVPMALSLKSPKELEAANLQLAHANEKLKEIDRLKDNFFSNISHELRTPLTLIIAPLESFLAKDYGSISTVQRNALETMHNNSIRLYQMVNSILDFAKISAQKIVVTREPVDIVALTQSIANEFNPLLRQKNINIEFKCSVLQKIVSLDRYLYERILFNLLSNATKFTLDQGLVSILLHFEGEKVILTVKDSGIGISKEDQEKLFQRFQQVEGSATRRFEGTGLGLALVKEFALLLEGDATVKSTLNKGSTFVVEITAPPATMERKTGNKSLEGRFQKFDTAPVLENQLAKEKSISTKVSKILIAEDNIELGTYTASLLNEFAETKLTRDGDEAWETIQKWKPDLVLLDVMMPKQDGISLCREIKSSPKTAHIPVILLTALTHRDALVRGWEAGADEYLFKPFHPKELITRIKLLLAHAIDNKLLQELNRKLVDSARLAGMSDVATSMLHNVGNILSSVNITTDLLLDRLSKSEINNLTQLTDWLNAVIEDPKVLTDDKQKQAHLIDYFTELNNNLLQEQKKCVEDVKILNKYIQNIKDIVTLQQKEDRPLGVIQEVNIAEILDESLRISLHDAIDIKIVKNYNDTLTAVLDKMKLEDILVTLMVNAKEALQERKPTEKCLIIHAKNKVVNDKEWLEIDIEDNGIGISPDILNKIFTFGFTTKSENCGFGLHFSALSTKEMGGKLSVTSPGENKGAIFSLKLPTIPPHTKKWVEITT